MRIDGKTIAEEIFKDLKSRVEKLKEKGITPKLVIVLIGEDSASASYVRQKELKANYVGIKAETLRFPTSISQAELLKTIEQLNNDRNVHGIIVQRPLPKQIDEIVIDGAVVSQKDVDGFRNDSPFLPPLGIAVYKIVEQIPNFAFKKIVIMGKGKTGGGPTIQVLKQREIPYIIVDSKTQNPNAVLRSADIIVSAVGKQNMLTKEKIKKGVVLIGVGMHRGEDGKLHGDYEEENIKDTAEKYTPIPGGVGPVNVAMLLVNVVEAAENLSKANNV